VPGSSQARLEQQLAAGMGSASHAGGRTGGKGQAGVWHCAWLVVACMGLNIKLLACHPGTCMHALHARLGASASQAHTCLLSPARAQPHLPFPLPAVTRAATGWLSSPITQSRLYQLLATASAALALASLCAPAQLASWAFQHATDPVVDAFVRSSGAALLASATTKWILKVGLTGALTGA
jgi:hypothetical protein